MNETTDIHDHGNKEKYCGQSRISLCSAGTYFIMLSLIPLLILLLSMIQFTGIGKSRFLQSDPAFGAAGIPKLDVEYY